MTKLDKNLHLNSDKGWFGGVCSGIADYFEIEAFIVRIITIVATLTWPLTIIVYVCLYFFMSKKKPDIAELSDQVSNSRIGKHFKNIDYKKRIYKSRYDKKISGVCAGLADYFETSAFFIRLALVLSLFFGPFAIFGYIIAAIVMDKEPEDEHSDFYAHSSDRKMRKETRKAERQQRRNEKMDERYGSKSANSETYRHHNQTSSMDKRDIADCDSAFSELEKKLQKLEATITSKKFRLHNEIKRMSAE